MDTRWPEELTLGAHAQEGYSSLFVCLSVTTSLAYLAAKTLEFGHEWTSKHTGMCLNWADFAKNFSIKGYAAICLSC